MQFPAAASIRLPLNGKTFKVCAIAAGLLASGVALADAHLDPQLLSKMATAVPTDELQVIVSYEQSVPVTAGQVAALKALGIERGITMRALPIAGVLATPAEIRALAQRDDVASIYFNAPVQFFNKEAREIVGAARAMDNPADYGRAIPFSGHGVTVIVNDTGIDGTHDDLKFGNHVVENVQAAVNLNLLERAEEAERVPVPPGILPITYLEGQPNTDLGSGHGTHCAGTVGGTGARSNGKYRGVAPGADLIGYGSGAVVLVLDAVGGFDYAIVNQFTYDHPIRVISNSWGSGGPFDPTDPVSIGTYEAYKHGIVSVFAAGNSGPDEDKHNPYAQAPWVISVGAGEKDGVLAEFSSRGKRGESEGGSFTMPDGKSWTYINEPTITAPGVGIVSTRTLAGVLPVGAPGDENLDPAAFPFYTTMSGTSMSTPHVAGIVALLFEANPNLTPAQVKAILEDTATNMAGREPWEVGAGYVNAYAAVAQAAGLRNDFGSTVNALRTFNSYANPIETSSQPFALDYSPTGEAPTYSFVVTEASDWVAVKADLGNSFARILLTEPDGTITYSPFSYPGLESKVSVGAAAKPGTWKATFEPFLGVPAAPEAINGTVGLITVEYTGLKDIAGHAAQGAIEFAVGKRLLDGDADGNFRPDQWLKRGELAQYLVMGGNVRQYLPFDGGASFSDLSTLSPAYASAEAAINTGASLRDLSQQQAGVMGLYNGAFRANDTVTRVSLAYSLVQALALQDQAQAFSGTLTVLHDGKRIAIEDTAAITPSLRGYVQLALDLELINARFTVTQGPFDLQPTLRAHFDPGVGVTRGAYAVAASRYLGVWRSAED